VAERRAKVLRLNAPTLVPRDGVDVGINDHFGSPLFILHSDGVLILTAHSLAILHDGRRDEFPLS
jgi:hypothetical protein